ncbi:hypothetical protein SK128_007100, partial [Halocaridina rubra]
NVEGENLIAKAGRREVTRKRQQNRSKSSSDGGEEGPGGEQENRKSGSKAKRAQYCTICKNHNQRVLKKRHKCPHSDCQCPLCQLSRRVQCIMCHQQRLWRFRKSMEKNGISPNNKEVSIPTVSSPSSSTSSLTESDIRLQESLVDDPSSMPDSVKSILSLKPERNGKQQVCDKCRNHDKWVLKRGHKGKCPYENCTCQYCSFTIKRRNLMKHQQRVRRAQVTSQPVRGQQDFIMQPNETSADQQLSPTPPTEDLPMGNIQQEAMEKTIRLQDSASPPGDFHTGSSPGLAQPSPGLDQENAHQVCVNDDDQSNTPAAWKSCSNKTSPISSIHGTRLAYATPSDANIPLIKSDRSQEQCVSPNVPQVCSTSQVVSPRIDHEPILSPVIPQETRMDSDITLERHFSPVCCSESNISPVMSNEKVMPPLESLITQSNYYEPNTFPVMSNDLRTSLANSRDSDVSNMMSSELNTSLDNEQRISQMMSHEQKYSLSSCQGSVYCQSASQETKFSQVMSQESRISTNLYNESDRENIPFSYQSAMHQGASSTSLTGENMPSPINYFKQEPITDENMLYDNMGTEPMSADYSKNVHDDDAGMSFVNDTEVQLMRQSSLPKYGVDPDDLQLREWNAKRTMSGQSYLDSIQTNNVRGNSHNMALTHSQQHLLPQNNTMNQHSYYQVMSSTRPTFESHSFSFGWGANVPNPCTTTTRSTYSSEIIQSRHTTVPMPNCEPFLHSSQHQSHSLWWQQARIGSLERTNSC